jgi:DegV family protein with EDD domain
VPRIALVCDSTADLSAAEQQSLDVAVVPLNVHFGSDILRDHVDITPGQFLDRLANATEMPRTSQPSPAAFGEAYKVVASHHDAILVLTLSSRLSGTYQSAVLGIQTGEVTVPVRVVDSLSASIGLGLQVRRARELINQGLELEQIAATLERERGQNHLIFFADTLEFLQRGGRIGKASQLVGTLLKIKPLLIVVDGEVVPYERTRSRSRAIEGLIEYARQFPVITRVAILFDGTSIDDVTTITRGISDRVPESAVIVERYGPIVATHVGPGALGISVFAEQSAEG